MRLVPVVKVNIVNLAIACEFLRECGYRVYFLPSPCAIFLMRLLFWVTRSLVGFLPARLLTPLFFLLLRAYGLVAGKGYWVVYVAVED